jgi:hypothetical protein
MFDLLPGRLRWSSELPDDEGKVFVTCVPGAPIQVLGRIGEHEGRLYIGSIATPGAGARDFNKEDLARDLAAANMRMKLVDGPDAVELIADIQRKRPDLVAKAKGRQLGSPSLADLGPSHDRATLDGTQRATGPARSLQ